MLYRAGSAAQPIPGTTLNQSGNFGGNFTMSFDVLSSRNTNGSANTIKGFKFGNCYTNTTGAWGGFIGQMIQDGSTVESIGGTDAGQGQYPINPAGVTFQGVAATGINAITPFFITNTWFRLVCTFNRWPALAFMNSGMACRTIGNFLMRGYEQANSNGHPTAMQYLCCGGRYRVDADTAVTMTAPPVAATSATLTANWTGATLTGVLLTFNGGGTRVGNVTNGSTAVTWTTAITDGSASLNVREKFPDGFWYPGTAFANFAFWDDALVDQDYHSLLSWTDPMSIRRRPAEFYPLELNEGASPTDIIKGYKLTEYQSPYAAANADNIAPGFGMRHWSEMAANGYAMPDTVELNPPSRPMSNGWSTLENMRAMLGSTGGEDGGGPSMSALRRRRPR